MRPGPVVQLVVVLLPCGDGVILIGAACGEDRIPQLAQRFFGGQFREHGCGPGGGGCRDDGPVDVVASDQFQRRTVGL